jgi:hypothetical protein
MKNIAIFAGIILIFINYEGIYWVIGVGLLVSVLYAGSKQDVA